MYQEGHNYFDSPLLAGGSNPHTVELSAPMNPLDASYPRPNIQEAMQPLPTTNPPKMSQNMMKPQVDVERAGDRLTLRKLSQSDLTVDKPAGKPFPSSYQASQAEQYVRGTNLDRRNPVPTIMSQEDYIQTGVEPGAARIENMAKRAGFGR